MDIISKIFNKYEDPLAEFYLLKKRLLCRPEGLNIYEIDSSMVENNSYTEKSFELNFHKSVNFSPLIKIRNFQNSKSFNSYEYQNYIVEKIQKNVKCSIFESHEYSLRNIDYIAEFGIFDSTEYKITFKVGNIIYEINDIQFKKNGLYVFYKNENVFESIKHLYQGEKIYINAKIIPSKIRQKVEESQQINVSNSYYQELLKNIEDNFREQMKGFNKNIKFLLIVKKIFNIKTYKDIDTNINLSYVGQQDLDVLDIIKKIDSSTHKNQDDEVIKKLIFDHSLINSYNILEHPKTKEYIEKLKRLENV